jgi:protein TonB
MDRRLFEDLVESTPAGPQRRRAALMPLSIALHGGALTLALIAPSLRAVELPVPALAPPVWEVPIRIATPPPLRTERPRVAVRAASSDAPRRPAVIEEPPAAASAPGPPVSTEEPGFLPPDESPSPCLVNCTGSDGTGDGPPEASDPLPQGGRGAGLPVVPGGNIKAPIRTVYVPPVFPDIARAAGVSGIVVIECTIDPSGHVADARVLTGHPLLDAAALSAVKQWRYMPTRLNDLPVPVLMTVTVRFRSLR